MQLHALVKSAAVCTMLLAGVAVAAPEVGEQAPAFSGTDSSRQDLVAEPT
jgi:hypothetical protein